MQPAWYIAYVTGNDLLVLTSPLPSTCNISLFPFFFFFCVLSVNSALKGSKTTQSPRKRIWKWPFSWTARELMLWSTFKPCRPLFNGPIPMGFNGSSNKMSSIPGTPLHTDCSPKLSTRLLYPLIIYFTVAPKTPDGDFIFFYFFSPNFSASLYINES